MFILVSGSSGVGKNTVLNEVYKRKKEVKPFITYTTRKIREGEINGIHYHFIDKDEFLSRYEQGKFCEMEEIHGNYYGSQMQDIEEAIYGDKILIKDLGVEGVKNLIDILGKENVITIFIDAPKEVLKQRLESRGEKEIELRLSRYDYEHTFLNQYDYIVENIDLNDCVEEILEIIENHKKKLVEKEEKNVRVNENIK